MKASDRIYIAGHEGMVGSALVRHLESLGFHELLLKSRSQLDLTDQRAVRDFFSGHKPDYVFLAAAKVGGILINSLAPAEFIHQNLAIQTNIINEAYRSGVKRLLFLGSSCIYPKECLQPMSEEHLLTGPLEPTNEFYAVAKIAGVKMCQAYNRQYGTDFISVMPTNLYGPGDRFDSESSHVIPAMIAKFHEALRLKAPSVTLWGRGEVRREFLHVDDLARACVLIMKIPKAGLLEPAWGDSPWINIGSGEEVSIAYLAEMIGKTLGYRGSLHWDQTKPEGPARKLLDSSRIKALGWAPKIGLQEGLRGTADWFEANIASAHWGRALNSAVTGR